MFITDGTPDFVCARYASLKAAAQAGHYGVFDENVVVLDTETTGLSFAHDELIQIAAARMVNGEITEWYTTFVNPGKPIPEDITHLTGITDAHVEGAPCPDAALQGLANFVGDAYVVAHNVGFDHNFVTKHPGGYPLLENTWVDSLDLARIALPRLTSHRLLDLVRAFDAPLSTHRADADVEATCAMFRILLAAVDAMPAALVSKIAALAPREEWPTGVVFDYFAQRKQQEGAAAPEVGGEPEVGTSPATVPAPADSSPAPATNVDALFSLRSLRRQAVKDARSKPKEDADELAADPARGISAPDEAMVAAAFNKGGLVGRLYPRFEKRQEQADMAVAVTRAFAASENLVVEAGTGVGKSMAYLLPAALLAKRNNITVGIATKTNALLDQLMYHELPALAEGLGGLTYASLKGFSHYPCLLKVDRLVAEGAKMREVAGKEVSQAPALAGLLSFIEQTVYDDIDTLKIDYRSVPRWLFTTTSHDCLRRKCPYFGTSCFVHGARRQAESADIVVTNHTLMFCDLKADGGLLPTARHWVIDEAHGAETEARRAFSLTLAAEDILRVANRLRTTEPARNPFVRAERVVAGSCGEEAQTLLYALTAKAKAAGESFAETGLDFVKHMKDLLYFDQAKRGKGYEIFELWINDQVRNSATFSTLAGKGRNLCEALDKLIRAAQDVVAYLEDFDEASNVQRDIASLTMNCKDLLSAAEVVLGPARDEFAYSATLNRKKDKVGERLEALLVNVSSELDERLYQRTHSIIFASATLTVNNAFSAFEQALGLNASEHARARTLKLDSSYNFDKNMTVYIPSDLPEPNDLAYLPALQHFLRVVHVAQGGSMLTLFTNRKEMESCFDQVNPALKEAGLRLVCQKWGVSVKGLRDDFLKDESLSLFALKSFWEGFDAPGSTLRGVIIPKLPFAKPSDPLSCERATRDDNAWRHYVLPAAVIETKQAAGRLIRTEHDTGVLILADRRLLTKSYGKAFINSMPSKNVKVLTCAEIAQDIANGRRSD
ncbi:MAG: helicase C-terminal domain-containing protein [Coriobacteriia bacterium]|nr:helicase C-terminal domain-containing protein [Coriobacteriia bacterium]